MTSTPAQRSVTKINPMFAIPDGTDELEYKEINTDTAVATDSSGNTSPTDEVGVDVELIPDETVFIDVPSILSVVSQTLRRAPGGNNVVDMVIEIDGNGIGIDKYEFRVAKT